ncbi:MAG: flippase [Thermoleophilia bacterium]|nr:flippase [Thermoleophilia bacterium]
MARFKTVLRHSSYLFGSKLLTRLLYTVFIVYAAARLGPELFGVLAFTLAMVELLSWIGDLGLTRYGARELITSAREDRPVLSGQILALQLTSSVILCAAGLAAILAWSPPEPKMEMLLMGLVAVLFSGVVNATESALVASQKFFYSALLSFTGRLIFLGAGFVAISLGASVVVVMAGFLAGIAVESVLRLLLVSARLAGFSFRFRPAAVKAMFLASLPFAGAAVASVVYSQAGIVALEIFRDDADVGVYGVAYNLFIPLVWVSTVLAKAIFPGMTELHRESMDSARRYFYQWYRLLVMAGVPIAVAVTFLAGPALAFFPEGYEESAAVLIILMWSVPFLMISPNELNILQIIGREREAVRSLLTVMVFTVLLQFVLVPFYGVKGAAAAALGGALVREVQFYELVRSHFFLGKHFFVLFLRPAAAGAAMAAVALLAWNLMGPWVATAAGGAAYVATLFISGGVSISEIKGLARS